MIEYVQRAGNALLHRAEGGFNRIFGNELNPLYHLGPLTFFFFWIVLVSGVYVFIFFDSNVAGAWKSVEYMTHEQWWMAGIMRSLHRYASDAAVITIGLHLLREFCRDRYRGVRWFSWFTGVPTLWLVVLLGISGYWLVWDQMAQYLAMATAELVDWLPLAPGSMASNFLEGQMTDRFFILMVFLHLLGFPVALIFLLMTHVSRIGSVDFNPPRGLAIGTLGSLILLSIVKPAVSHPAADLYQSPITLNLDWFYLNIYPIVDMFGPGVAWTVSTSITLLFLVLPWLPPRKERPPAVVNLDHCDGCQQCARDCPFGAVIMRPRSDGRKFEFQPEVDPGLCTACGLCVGACHSSNPYRQPNATLHTGIDMPHLTIDTLRNQTVEAVRNLTGSRKIVLVGCEHCSPVHHLASSEVAPVTLPCSGMLPPSFVDYLLKKGADGVVLTGCREEDCYFRFGNRLTEQRVHGERPPKLFARTDRGKLRIVPASPLEGGDLAKALESFKQDLASSVGEEKKHG
ncbi:MAG: hydrogenase iron-sulfur subunit [Magnetococcales bacterium]|nr:hydrogenase iron-sulfur subunit [Magnetococcales bacterium]NGZ26035.1 hydrogenase iron-sulfur subunit [Magnetococcales bacterium]